MAHTHSVRTYCYVFAALIALTALTVVASFIELGPLHTAVGLLIATCKGALVALFFMNILAHRLGAVIMAGSLFWLGILLSLTVADYWTRG